MSDNKEIASLKNEIALLKNENVEFRRLNAALRAMLIHATDSMKVSEDTPDDGSFNTDEVDSAIRRKA